MTELSPSPIRLELRRRLDGLGPQWDRLVEAQALPSPFSKSWWIDHAAQGDPAVLCCFDRTTLVGGAAFELDQIGRGPLSVERVRCLGQGALAPDHLDIIAAEGSEDAVLDLVLGWLRRPGSRLIDLDGLAAEGRLATACAPHEIERTAAPFAALPATGEQYLAARRGQVRSTITRTRRRLERDGVSLRRVTPQGTGEGATVGPTGVDAALDRLAELHDGKWSDASEFLQGWDRFRAAAKDGAGKGDVVIHELVAADESVIAIELDLLTGNRLAFYQAGRRTEREWRGAGSVLRAGLIDWACDEGITEYDLLRGDESYKVDWASERRELVRCRLGVGTRGRALAMAAHRWRSALPTVMSGANQVQRLLSPGAWRRHRAARDEPTD